MKFLDIKKARGFKVGDQVYTLNDAGQYGVGKLVGRTEDANGTVLKFEVPQYTSKEAPPALEPVTVTNITHVAVMRDRKKGEPVEQVQEPSTDNIAQAMGNG